MRALAHPAALVGVLAAAMGFACAASSPRRPEPVTVDIAPTSEGPNKAEASSPTDAASPDLKVGATEIAAGLAEKLASGLRVNLIVEAKITGGGMRPTYVAVGTCSVTFDIRDELYRLEEVGGAAGHRAAVTLESVVRQCTDRGAGEVVASQTPAGASAVWIVRENRTSRLHE